MFLNSIPNTESNKFYKPSLIIKYKLYQILDVQVQIK